MNTDMKWIHAYRLFCFGPYLHLERVLFDEQRHAQEIVYSIRQVMEWQLLKQQEQVAY